MLSWQKNFILFICAKKFGHKILHMKNFQTAILLCVQISVFLLCVYLNEPLQYPGTLGCRVISTGMAGFKSHSEAGMAETKGIFLQQGNIFGMCFRRA